MFTEQEVLQIEEQKNTQLVMNTGFSPETLSTIQILKVVIDPLARSQETSEKEATKRIEIEFNLYTKFFLGIFIIASLLIILGTIALFKGQIELVEKIVIAILSFMGGLGFGKLASKK